MTATIIRRRKRRGGGSTSYSSSFSIQSSVYSVGASVIYGCCALVTISLLYVIHNNNDTGFNVTNQIKQYTNNYNNNNIDYNSDGHERNLIHTVPAIPSSSLSSSAVSILQQYFGSNVSVVFNRIQENIHFHQRGGNLKVYQIFLDNAIELTYKKNQIQFVPQQQQHTNTMIPIKRNITGYIRQYYQQNGSKHGGYGESLPGNFTKKSMYHNNNNDKSSSVTTTFENKNQLPKQLLYENRWIDVIEPRLGKLKWDVALGPVGPSCHHLIHIGNINDKGRGSKMMCLPIPESQQNDVQGSSRTALHATKEAANAVPDTVPECHILSIGGNDNWAFELGVQEQLKHCTTYTFDCTILDSDDNDNNRTDKKPLNQPNHPNIKFYNYCISGGNDNTNNVDNEYNNGNSKYITYQRALQIANITVAPIYVKMDVEGFEYDILTNILQTTPYDMLPIQIQVELHWNTRMIDLSWMLRNRNVGEILLLTSMMFTVGGFIPITYEFNPYCHSCMEVLYFRAAIPTSPVPQ